MFVLLVEKNMVGAKQTILYVRRTLHDNDNNGGTFSKSWRTIKEIDMFDTGSTKFENHQNSHRSTTTDFTSLSLWIHSCTWRCVRRDRQSVVEWRSCTCERMPSEWARRCGAPVAEMLCENARLLPLERDRHVKNNDDDRREENGYPSDNVARAWRGDEFDECQSYGWPNEHDHSDDQWLIIVHGHCSIPNRRTKGHHWNTRR